MDSNSKLASLGELLKTGAYYVSNMGAAEIFRDLVLCLIDFKKRGITYYDIVETVDSCGTDSIEVITRSGSESEGFGRCLVRGCNCKEFEGRGETCRNCGHA